MVSSLLVLRTVVIVFTATCRLSLLSLPAGAATLLQVALTPMMIMTLLLVYLVPAPHTRGFTSSQDPVQAHHSVPSAPLRHIAVSNPPKYFIGGHAVPRRRSATSASSPSPRDTNLQTINNNYNNHDNQDTNVRRSAALSKQTNSIVPTPFFSEGCTIKNSISSQRRTLP